MPNPSLGTIEVLGLPAAVEAADVALKTADVTLIGYETTDGMGMVAVKIEGQVSAVQSAVAAARAAASRVSKVFATSVIPRPSDQLVPVVLTEGTVGIEPASAPTPAAGLSESQPPMTGTDSDKSEEGVEPEVVAEPEPLVESVETLEPEPAAEAAAPKPRATRTRKPASKPAASK